MAACIGLIVIVRGGTKAYDLIACYILLRQPKQPTLKASAMCRRIKAKKTRTFLRLRSASLSFLVNITSSGLPCAFSGIDKSPSAS